MAGKICPHCGVVNTVNEILCGNCYRVMIALSGIDTKELGSNVPLPPSAALGSTDFTGYTSVKLMLAYGVYEMATFIDGPLIIGREGLGKAKPDIDLGAWTYSEYVSRAHVQLMQEKGLLVMRDLNAPNGTWLNGVKCTPGQPYPVADGSEIRLGLLTTHLTFEPRR